jgi:hypothetical protein
MIINKACVCSSNGYLEMLNRNQIQDRKVNTCTIQKKCSVRMQQGFLTCELDLKKHSYLKDVLCSIYFVQKLT